MVLYIASAFESCILFIICISLIRGAAIPKTGKMDLKKVRKIGIIGVGLMGGSLALALKSKYKDIEIIGYARSQKSFQNLRRIGVVDRIERCPKKIARQADILVLASPVGAIVDYLKKLSAFCKKGAVIFDLGSVKKEIEEAAKKYLPKDVAFVGCHPFCGSEKTGAKNAKPSLYRNSICFITSKNSASFMVGKIWERLGSRVIRISPAVHDELVCAVSHLPHLSCFSLVNGVPDKYLEFTSSGFKDFTRIASSSDKLWSDIFLSNKDKLIKAVDEQIMIFSQFRQAIKKNDRQKIQSLIKKANRKRNKIL